MRARDNPFRTTRLGALDFRHPSLSLDAIGARFRCLGRRAAIVGPQGSGKTTLLRALEPRLRAEGLRVRHWFLNAERRAPGSRTLVREARGLARDEVLLFDGAGHLTPRVWRRVERACSAAGGLLVTAHAEGLLPTLVETRTDAALLVQLTRELVGPAAASLEPLLAELFRAHRGNLRDAFLALYDLGARRDPRLLALVAPAESARPPRRGATPAGSSRPA